MSLFYIPLVIVLHDRDYFQIPRCFPMKGIPSMWSDTFSGQGDPYGK